MNQAETFNRFGEQMNKNRHTVKQKEADRQTI